MAQSWSSMRKVLEQENICDSLKGRIQYFATRYRKSHDEEGRVAIRFDGEEIFKSCFYDWQRKRDIVEASIILPKELSYKEKCDIIHTKTLNNGGFEQWCFYDAFYYYQNHNIKECLNYKDPIVKLLAILDKRVGKRTLHEILKNFHKEPKWLQVFYKLRLEADGIVNYEVRS